jgi:hypothetical protein
MATQKKPRYECLRLAQVGLKHLLSTVMASARQRKSCQAEIGQASADGGGGQASRISDHSMNKMFFEQLSERTISRFFSRTHRRERFGGLRNCS